MTDRPFMVRPYVSDPHVGDGFFPGFVLAERGENALLYLPSKLATVTVRRSALEKAQRLPYRPRVIRNNVLARAKLYRQHGHRFPRAATVQLLRLLGAGKATIEETVNVPMLPHVQAQRQARKAQAERAAEIGHAAIAIRQRIEQAPLGVERPAVPRRRTRQPHPDQLALEL